MLPILSVPEMLWSALRIMVACSLVNKLFLDVSIAHSLSASLVNLYARDCGFQLSDRSVTDVRQCCERFR